VRALLPVASLALSALALSAACGTGLYDAKGVPVQAPPGGLACDAGQISCGGVCTVESATQCGSACADCTAIAPPLHAVAACLADGACGYACQDGFVACDAGCCGAAALGAAAATTCALLDDGAVRCWGANDAGQVGDGTLVDRSAPTAVPLPAIAVAIGAGEHHACAVLSGGAVSCWGANDAGQATGTPSAGPAAVPATTPVGSGALAVAAGAAHTCALVGGAVKCWGANGSGQLGGTPTGGVATPIASGATAVAAGSNHTCALVGGAVECWGANGSGQLGGAPAAGIATPFASGTALLSASRDQACASSGVSSGGSLDPVLQCWGSSLGPLFGFAAPQPTPAIPLKQAGQATVRFSIDRLAAGRSHVCVQRTGELLYCLGPDDGRGQLGALSIPAGSTEAWPVSGNLTAILLAAGADHTCAALSGGRLRCWGANDRGQLGNGLFTDPGPGVVVLPLGH
jgi:alpha-tubulin suppressor-like RCC1 family protein